MDAATRAHLVRIARFELKQTREDQIEGHRRLHQIGRVRRRVEGGVRRAGQRVGAALDRALDAYSRAETARLRRVNMAEAAGRAASPRDSLRSATRERGISPAFRERSRQIERSATTVGARSRAGQGANRWRGSVAEVRRESPFRITEAQRTSRILAGRRRDVLDEDPFTYNPPRRERAPRGTMTSRPYRRARRVQHTTD